MLKASIRQCIDIACLVYVELLFLTDVFEGLIPYREYAWAIHLLPVFVTTKVVKTILRAALKARDPWWRRGGPKGGRPSGRNVR